MVFRHKSPILQFAALWFFITLLPSSSFIPLKQIATEHRTYLPGLGFSLALGWLFLNAQSVRALATGLLLAFLSLNYLLTVNRSLDYRSEIILWKDTVEKSPNKALVHNNLATAYMESEMLEEAKEELGITLQLNPALSDAYANFGHIHFQQNTGIKPLKNLIMLSPWILTNQIPIILRALPEANRRPMEKPFRFCKRLSGCGRIKPVITFIWETRCDI